MKVTTYLSMPYLGMDDAGEPTRNWAHFTFKHADGYPVDKRKIKRMVRKWIWQNLERRVHSEELHMLMKRVQYLTEDGEPINAHWLRKNRRYINFR